MVLVVGSDRLFQYVRRRLLPNQRREIFNFQIDQVNRFGFTNWSTNDVVDNHIAEYLASGDPFIYYRGGSDFNVFMANEQSHIDVAVAEIDGIN